MKHLSIVRAGAVQFDVKLGDVQANLRSIEEGIQRLAYRGAKLAALPELCCCGFDTLRLHRHAEKTPDIIGVLSRMAKDHRMVIAGSLPELHDGHVYNTLFLLDEKGDISGKYRKIHLFPLLSEADYFQCGSQPVLCRTALGCIGLMVCYDLRFPELCRSLALQGAQMVVVSAQWPEARIDHWDVLLRARAIENQLFMIAANRCGKDADLIFGGHSQIISPSGKVMAMLGDDASEAIAEIDLSDISSSRKQFDCLKDRVPSAY